MKKAFILLAAAVFLTVLSSGASAQTPAVTPAVTAAPASGSSSNYKDGLLDVNKATKDQLMALGLDSATADKLIAERPFQKKTSLVTHGVMSQSEYSKIHNKIYAWWPIRGGMTTR